MAILKNQLKDFAQVGITLVWQRQIMFLGAAFMMGYYISTKAAIICYLLILINEILDFQIFKHIMKWNGRGAKTAKRFLDLLALNSSFGAIMVCAFIVIMANKEGNPLHFTPLFLLFAAGLFAAMNNHQLLKVLLVRLGFYGATFIYIPTAELWKMYILGEADAPAIPQSMETSLWLQFFTVLFVLYFIVDCSRIFLRLYRKGQKQKAAIVLERDRAKQAYVLQSQFVSVVSHELRTPLTSIKGGLSLLDSGVLGAVPAKIKSVTDIAFKNSIRLGALIDDLLDVQKFEFGKMDLQPERINLAALVAESVEANESFNNGMNVTFKIHGTETPVYAEADYNRLMQVMANILSNAVKFSSQDGIIEVRLESIGDNARISVRDYGAGIPEGSANKVFGQFSQVDSSIERKIGGTGLGMYITKKIMDCHNGSIDYVSKLNEGTTFFVDIPRSKQK